MVFLAMSDMDRNSFLVHRGTAVPYPSENGLFHIAGIGPCSLLYLLCPSDLDALFLFVVLDPLSSLLRMFLCSLSVLYTALIANFLALLLLRILPSLTSPSHFFLTCSTLSSLPHLFSPVSDLQETLHFASPRAYRLSPFREHIVHCVVRGRIIVEPPESAEWQSR